MTVVKHVTQALPHQREISLTTLLKYFFLKNEMNELNEKKNKMIIYKSTIEEYKLIEEKYNTNNKLYNEYINEYS